MKKKNVDFKSIIQKYDKQSGEFQVLELRLKNGKKDGTGVVVVLSTIEGEGKSVTAVHLSRALTRAGDKTILIDGNPFNPSVSGLYASGAAAGFSQNIAVSGNDLTEDTVESTIVDSGEGFSVMPWGGRLNGTPPGGNPETLFKILKKMGYTSIVVDGPSVKDKSFGLILAAHSEAVLAVVAAGRVASRELAEFKERINSTGTVIAGFVLNKFRF